MTLAHEFILVGGALGVLSIFAAPRLPPPGRPCAAGLPGPRHAGGRGWSWRHPYDDFSSAYLIGSVALAVILFEGGLKTHPVHAAPRPLAGLHAGRGRRRHHRRHRRCDRDVARRRAVRVRHADRRRGRPTDAAAVGAMLGQARLVLARARDRTAGSGIRAERPDVDLPRPSSSSARSSSPPRPPGRMALLLFAEEMIGGAALGLGGGWLLVAVAAPHVVRAAHRNGAGADLRPGTVRPGAGTPHQRLHGGLSRRHRDGATEYRGKPEVANFYEGFSWLAHIVLFLMLGLIGHATRSDPLHGQQHLRCHGVDCGRSASRGVSRACCRSASSWRESAFASWVGLRGAVPIYISFIPALADPLRDERLFSGVFVVVVVSLIIQGWTIRPVARLLGYRHATS